MNVIRKGSGWISRCLLWCPYYVGLCITDEAFQRELKRLGVKRGVEFMGSAYADATTHYFEKKEMRDKFDMNAAIVTITPRPEKLIQVHGLLVHEAVHIWQRSLDVMGERHVGDETEAYSIQSLSQNLFLAYRQLTEGQADKPVGGPTSQP